ncbi:unnamed protein product [Amoebophrya sp. A25]|nr:unnamed protein product [Amoebophrya sp. A25]|eukprot:GSA25T00017360001.1
MIEHATQEDFRSPAAPADTGASPRSSPSRSSNHGVADFPRSPDSKKRFASACQFWERRSSPTPVEQSSAEGGSLSNTSSNKGALFLEGLEDDAIIVTRRGGAEGRAEAESWHRKTRTTRTSCSLEQRASGLEELRTFAERLGWGKGFTLERLENDVRSVDELRSSEIGSTSAADDAIAVPTLLIHLLLLSRLYRERGKMLTTSGTTHEHNKTRKDFYLPSPENLSLSSAFSNLDWRQHWTRDDPLSSLLATFAGSSGGDRSVDVLMRELILPALPRVREMLQEDCYTPSASNANENSDKNIKLEASDRDVLPCSQTMLLPLEKAPSDLDATLITTRPRPAAAFYYDEPGIGSNAEDGIPQSSEPEDLSETTLNFTRLTSMSSSKDGPPLDADSDPVQPVVDLPSDSLMLSSALRFPELPLPPLDSEEESVMSNRLKALISPVRPLDSRLRAGAHAPTFSTTAPLLSPATMNLYYYGEDNDGRNDLSSGASAASSTRDFHTAGSQHRASNAAVNFAVPRAWSTTSSTRNFYTTSSSRTTEQLQQAQAAQLERRSSQNKSVLVCSVDSTLQSGAKPFPLYDYLSNSSGGEHLHKEQEQKVERVDSGRSSSSRDGKAGSSTRSTTQEPPQSATMAMQSERDTPRPEPLPPRFPRLSALADEFTHPHDDDAHDFEVEKLLERVSPPPPDVLAPPPPGFGKRTGGSSSSSLVVKKQIGTSNVEDIKNFIDASSSNKSFHKGVSSVVVLDRIRQHGRSPNRPTTSRWLQRDSMATMGAGTATPGGVSSTLNDLNTIISGASLSTAVATTRTAAEETATEASTSTLDSFIPTTSFVPPASTTTSPNAARRASASTRWSSQIGSILQQGIGMTRPVGSSGSTPKQEEEVASSSCTPPKQVKVEDATATTIKATAEPSSTSCLAHFSRRKRDHGGSRGCERGSSTTKQEEVASSSSTPPKQVKVEDATATTTTPVELEVAPQDQEPVRRWHTRHARGANKDPDCSDRENSSSNPPEETDSSKVVIHKAEAAVQNLLDKYTGYFVEKTGEALVLEEREDKQMPSGEADVEVGAESGDDEDDGARETRKEDGEMHVKSEEERKGLRENIEEVEDQMQKSSGDKQQEQDMAEQELKHSGADSINGEDRHREQQPESANNSITQEVYQDERHEDANHASAPQQDEDQDVRVDLEDASQTPAASTNLFSGFEKHDDHEEPQTPPEPEIEAGIDHLQVHRTHSGVDESTESVGVDIQKMTLDQNEKVSILVVTGGSGTSTLEQHTPAPVGVSTSTPAVPVGQQEPINPEDCTVVPPPLPRCLPERNTHNFGTSVNIPDEFQAVELQIVDSDNNSDRTLDLSSSLVESSASSKGTSRTSSSAYHAIDSDNSERAVAAAACCTSSMLCGSSKGEHVERESRGSQQRGSTTTKSNSKTRSRKRKVPAAPPATRNASVVRVDQGERKRPRPDHNKIQDSLAAEEPRRRGPQPSAVTVDTDTPAEEPDEKTHPKAKPSSASKATSSVLSPPARKMKPMTDTSTSTSNKKVVVANVTEPEKNARASSSSSAAAPPAALVLTEKRRVVGAKSLTSGSEGEAVPPPLYSSVASPITTSGNNEGAEVLGESETPLPLQLQAQLPQKQAQLSPAEYQQATDQDLTASSLSPVPRPITTIKTVGTSKTTTIHQRVADTSVTSSSYSKTTSGITTKMDLLFAKNCAAGQNRLTRIRERAERGVVQRGEELRGRMSPLNGRSLTPKHASRALRGHLAPEETSTSSSSSSEAPVDNKSGDGRNDEETNVSFTSSKKQNTTNHAQAKAETKKGSRGPNTSTLQTTTTSSISPVLQKKARLSPVVLPAALPLTKNLTKSPSVPNTATALVPSPGTAAPRPRPPQSPTPITTASSSSGMAPAPPPPVVPVVPSRSATPTSTTSSFERRDKLRAAREERYKQRMENFRSRSKQALQTLQETVERNASTSPPASPPLALESRIAGQSRIAARGAKDSKASVSPSGRRGVRNKLLTNGTAGFKVDD